MDRQQNSHHKRLYSAAASHAGTKAAMVFERLLPLILPSLAVIAIFLSALWFGLFRALPIPAQYVALCLAAAAFAAALWQLRSFEWPQSQEINARLERHNALAHTPLRSQSDTLPAGSSPLERILWQEHQTRMKAKLGNLEAGRPKANIAPKPSYLAYTALACITVIALAFSQAPKGGRWSDILAEQPVLAAIPPRIDLWVTPPDYTGLAPKFISDSSEIAAMDAPMGSVVSLRISETDQNNNSVGIPSIDLTFAPHGAESMTIAPEKPGFVQMPLQKSGILRVISNKVTLREVAFNVASDNAPTIQWNGPIDISRNGSFELKYITDDDYGIRKASGVLAFATPDQTAEPLYDMPDIALRIKSSAGEAAGQSRIALGDHPLAGIPMIMTLQAEDAIAQIGKSEPRTVILPQRGFTNPLAKALVEQRRLLARNKRTAPRIKLLMEAIMLHPEDTIDDSSAFLGIRTAYTRLRNAQDDDELRGIVDYLWEIALSLEQGQMNDAEKRLQAAREALRDAIENGASDEEIARLTQEMREALNNYMEELARQSQQNQNQQQQAQNPQNSQQVRPQDLNQMLDQIEDLAKQGAREQAEQLLSQMDQILDNLQAGQSGQQQQQQGGQQSQMQQQMNELGEIMRQQQELMDQTFNQQQQGQEPGQEQGEGQQAPNSQPNGQQGENGEAMQGLQQGQQALRQRLQQFGQSLESMGIDPGEEFGNAEGSMGQAGESLGQGDAQSATGQQSDALQALRRGAGEMMQQMQQAMEGQNGQNPGQAQQSPRNGQDPLGRQTGSRGPDFNNDVKVPDEIDMQRAREILNAIRKRLGDSAAPNSEKDYLERLLDFD